MTDERRVDEYTRGRIDQLYDRLERLAKRQLRVFVALGVATALACGIGGSQIVANKQTGVKIQEQRYDSALKNCVERRKDRLDVRSFLARRGERVREGQFVIVPDCRAYARKVTR